MEIIPFIQRVTGIVTCVALVALGVVVYLQLSVDPAGERYVVYFDESVDGLSKGAKVTYNGLDVGYVESIHPITDGADPMAGKVAVVFVIKEESIGEDGGAVVYGEPKPEDYHPWVSWVDPGLSPVQRRDGLQRHDWILAVGGTPVSTVADFDERVQEAALRHDEINGQVLYDLTVRRAGKEIAVPIRTRELQYVFSEGGTRATMAQNLVTQIRHIGLIGGHPGLPRLRGVSTRSPTAIVDLPRLETTETGLAPLMRLVTKKLPSILQNVDLVTANLAQLTRDLKHQTDTLDEILLNVRDLTDPDAESEAILREGAKSFESARRSLERIEGELAAGGHIYESLANLERLLAKDGEVVTTLKSAQELMATLDGQFDEGSEIHDTLAEAKGTLEEIREAVVLLQGYMKDDGKVTSLLTRTEATVGDMQQSLSVTGRIGGTLDDVRYTVRQDLRPMLRQLTETMRVMQETMARFNANPNPVISGRAQPED